MTLNKIQFSRLRKNSVLKILALGLFVFSFTRTHAQTPANVLLMDSVYAYMVTVGIKHADIVLKQIIVETGWLKSPFLMKKNNLFGFCSSSGYMNFPSWRSSVDYYKTWQVKYYTDHKEDYYKFLIRVKYASSVTYTEYLKKIELPEKYQEKKGLFK